MVAGPVFLLVATPLFAELISTYLASSGDLVAGVVVIVFLAPLYGGAALAIREVTVRNGLGWPARLMLAAGFGVLMPTLVDGSLFLSSNDDVDNWDEIIGSTAVVGISVYALTAWIVGHVVISVAAPIAIAEALFCGQRSAPWVSLRVLAVIVAFGLGVAMLIRADPASGRADAGGLLVSAVVVAAVVFAALRMHRVEGRSRGRRSRRWGAVAAVGFALMLAFDLAPISWVGVTVMVSLVAAGSVVLVRVAGDDRWGWREMGALGFGLVAGRATIGFLVPIPDDVAPAAKYTQNVMCLALVIALGVVLQRRATRPPGDMQPD